MNPSLTISKLTSSIVEFCKDALKAMCISRYHNSVHQIFEGCVQYFSSIHLYFPLNVGWIMFGKIRLADISFRGLGTIFCCSAKKLSSHLKWVLQGKDEVAAVAKSGIFWLIWRLYEDFPYHDLSVGQSTCWNNQSFTRSYQKVQKCNKTTCCLWFRLSMSQILKMCLFETWLKCWI